MSQNMRNPANEGQGGSGRTTNENVRNGEPRQFEGFEGMNYEQIRGPYNPKKRDGAPQGGNGDESNSGRRQDNL
jgi:hypothetical protein